uniref:F17-like fimbrial subunit n=1 Tax=Gallibacterium anatis TaxID=750 RepID=A0A1L2YZ21_9PAST|nr:F17-like fimbrial subunit [Gallibacterium anatis]
MKKLLLTTLVVAGLGLSAQGAFAEAPSAANSTNGGLITITGQVTDTTCLINGQENGNLTVQLPPVSTKALATQGATTGDTAFTIELSGCQSATNQLATYAAAFFVNESDKVTADGKLINKPDSGGAAQNVVVQLLHGDGTVIDVTKDYKGQTPDDKRAQIASNKATLKYKARYYATNAAGAGAVKSTVNYTIAYE